MPLFTSILQKITNNDMEGIKKIINEADLIDVTYLIQDLNPDDRVIVFRLLNKELAMEVFEQLDVAFQEMLLTSFTHERAIETISSLDPDDRVRLLDDLPARVAKKLIASLSAEERELTADLLGYPPETAGRIMNPKYIRLKGELTVQEALEKLRQTNADDDVIYTLYVTDDRRRLKGVVSLRDLIMAQSNQLVHQIMEQVVSVSTTTDQEAVVRILQERDLLAVPVVDGENRLVGIVTIDDAMDILQEETTEDIFDKAGLTSLSQQESGRSNRLVYGSLVQIWQVRLPFLLITLAGGLMAGAVIDTFEETLAAMAAVAIFIPIIMDMGGNAGTQSSTIFARALVLGHINTKRFTTHWFKEITVGLSMGIFLGVGSGIIAQIWQGIPGISIAVGAALATTVTLATALGFLVPFTLYRLGLDQAAGSDPIITTIKDISGLLIYFYFVNLLINLL